MAKYLLIESEDPYRSNDVGYFYDLVAGLHRDGNQVTLFLVQNGVLPARRSSRSEPLAALARAGVEILADDFSLRERGIGADRLVAGVAPGSIDTIIDRLAEGHKVLWH